MYAEDADVVFPDLSAPNREEMRTEFHEILEGVPDRRFDIVRIVSTEKGAFVECLIKGTNTGSLMRMPPTGKSLDMPMVHIYDFKDGKVVRQRSYANYQIMIR